MAVSVAALLFFMARVFNSPDCSTIRFGVYTGGIYSFLRMTGLATVCLLFGMPISVVAFFLGIFAMPLIGTSISLAAVAIAVLSASLLGKLSGAQHPSVMSLQNHLQGKLWFSDMRQASSVNGMRWAFEQVINTPLPLSLFAFYNSATIPHLSPPALVSGIVLATSVVAVSYTFAGSYIGCAVIDFTAGLPLTKYYIPVILSCALLLVSFRLRPRYSA
jgi:hypothetical protein